MDDYDDYGQEEDIIEYNYDEYDIPQDDNYGINLEDMFLSIQDPDNAIDDYKQIIELEKDNSTECKWSYKAYEKLCLIYINRRDLEEFKNNFDKLFSLYNRVDDSDKQDTIRNCTFHLNDIEDKEFVIEVLRFMLEMLKEKEVERAVMDTGLQFARTLFNLNRNEELGDLLDELLSYMERLDSNDEIYKSIKLELLVMKIQHCNLIKDSKETRRLYFEAHKLNQEQIINDTRLSAIINEEGGKLFLRKKEFELALEKFKSAFYNFQEAGNIRAKILLKYAILSSIISRNRKNIVSPEEAKPYLNDEGLKIMLELQSAYEEMDIIRINIIWNKISKVEDDSFILENLNEILHNIRFNYICGKLKAYRICSFSTLEKELCIDRIYLISILHEIILTDTMNAKLNLIENYIQVIEVNEMKENTLSNFGNWICILNK